MIYSIYLITNLVNNKFYVGYTSMEPEERWKLHISASMTNRKSKEQKQHIHNAISKYGVDNFRFEVIYQSIEEMHCLQMETYFIKEYNTFNSPFGYNHTTGGEDRRRSIETIEKHRAKIKGRPQSEEHKRKKGLAIRGEKNGMYGRKLDKNVAREMAILSAESRRIYMQLHFSYYYVDVWGNLFSVKTKEELVDIFGVKWESIKNRQKNYKFYNNLLYCGRWKSLLE